MRTYACVRCGAIVKTPHPPLPGGTRCIYCLGPLAEAGPWGRPLSEIHPRIRVRHGLCLLVALATLPVALGLGTVAAICPSVLPIAAVGLLTAAIIDYTRP